MPALVADVRYALRALRAKPSFALVALLSLALGIGANTTIFSIANALLFSELPVPHPEQLARIVRGGHSPLDYQSLRYIRDHATTVAAVIGEDLTSGTLATDDGRAERFDGAFVTGEYFRGLEIRPALGTFFAQSDDVPSANGPIVVLSYQFWQTRFGGDPTIIGKRLRLNGSAFTVLGVAPDGFASAELGWRPSAWIPISDFQAFTSRPLSDFTSSIYTTVRLKPGVDVQRAAAEIDGLAAQLRRADSAQYAQLNFRTLPARGVEEEQRQLVTVLASALLALVSIVLVIACANVGNLLLARATGRRQEIGIRLALGASRGRLMQQLLVESTVLALIGGLLGFALAFAATKVLGYSIASGLPVAFDVTPDLRVLAFALVLCVVTAMVFGLAPAIRATRPDLVESLKHDVAIQGLKRSRLRSALLVTQVAMGLVLLAAAALFARSLDHARSMDPGFRAEGVVNLGVDLRSRHYDDARSLAVFSDLLTRARQIPGVTSASLTSIVLLEGTNAETRVQVGNATEGDRSRLPQVSFDIVSSDFFKTMSIPIVAGRAMEETDIVAKAPVAVITEAMARALWPNQSAVGQTFHLADATSTRYEVIGVARDVKYYMIGDDRRSVMFLPVSREIPGALTLQVKTDQPTAAIARRLEALARELEPSLPPARAKGMREDTAIAYLPARIGAAMFGTFGLLALVIAMVGIYGVTSYIVAQRTRELGVRAALGAQSRDLVSIGLRDTLRLVGIGVAVGLPLSYGIGRALSALPILYDARAGDPLVLGAATVILVGVAAIASYVPALRAGRADPIVALRAR